MQCSRKVPTTRGVNLHKGKFGFIFPYLDDLIVFSKKESEHSIHLEKVLGTLEKAKICLNAEKCQFFKKDLIKLNNLVIEAAIKPDTLKIKTIQSHKLPSTHIEPHSYLGLINFCRNYFPNLPLKHSHYIISLTGKITQPQKFNIPALQRRHL